jgi:hypothetical protein
MDQHQETDTYVKDNETHYLYYPQLSKSRYDYNSNKFELIYNKSTINDKWLRAIEFYKEHPNRILCIKCTTHAYVEYMTLPLQSSNESHYKLFIFIQDSIENTTLLEMKKYICKAMDYPYTKMRYYDNENVLQIL